jgi:hypothetical protein
MARTGAADILGYVPPELHQGKEWYIDFYARDPLTGEMRRKRIKCNRIKAIGRIAAAASGKHPAFSASYDLVTDDSGATKRLSLNVSTAERDRQLSIARDEENMWLITDHEGDSRAAFGGAVDVDMVLSPFFNALPIRRVGVHRSSETVTVPVVYVYLPDLTVEAAEITYTGSGDGAVKLKSPVAETTVIVDDNGFVIDYPGLAERI